AFGSELVELPLVDVLAVLDAVLPAVLQPCGLELCARPAPAAPAAGRRSDPVGAEHVQDLVADAFGVGAEGDQDTCRDAVVLACEAEQDVLGADVVVADPERFPQRELEHLLRPRRERDLAGRRLLAEADDLLHLRADGVGGDLERAEGAGGDALLLAQEPEQEVLGADVVVLEGAGLFLRQDDHVPRPLREPLEHRAKGYASAAGSARRRCGRTGALSSRSRLPLVTEYWIAFR